MNIQLAGVDDGYYATKIAVLDPATGSIKTASFRSKAGAGAQGQAVDGSYAAESYETDGIHMLVTEFGGDIDTRSEDYATSDVNRVLIHHALRSVGLGGQRVHLASALPAKTYFSSQASRSKKAESLKRPVKGLDGHPCAVIEAQDITAQGMAAIFDWAFDDAGNQVHSLSDPEDAVAVIDIGGNTTDVVTLIAGQNGPIVLMEGTDSFNAGVMNVIDYVHQACTTSLGLEYLSKSQVGRSLVAKVLKYSDKTYPIEEIVDRGVMNIASSIGQFVKTKIRPGLNYTKILICGGGAYLFGPHLKTGHLGNAEIVRQPEFANARGLLKMLLNAQLGARVDRAAA